MPVVRVILREGQEKLYYEAQASIHTPDRTLRVVLKVVALIFQGIERLIFNLPASTSTSHQAINSALAHPQVCYQLKCWV